MKMTHQLVASIAALTLTATVGADQLLNQHWADWVRAGQPIVTYNGGLWPELGVGATVVAQSAVPQPVWSEQRTWVSRVVRAAWIPANLGEQSTAARFLGDDVLAYRMSANGWLLQVSDDASGVTILAKPTSALSGSSDEQVRQVLAAVTNYPEDKFGQLSVRDRSREHGGQAGFTFTGRALGSTPLGEHAWWQHFQGLSDGRCLLIRFPKLDGTQKPINATVAPAGRLRFNIN